jgi:hypothetical protein
MATRNADQVPRPQVELHASVHEEVVQNLLSIMQHLQDLSPLESVGGQNWWRRYKAIEQLYETAKEYALLTIPEDIETLLISIKERRDALIPTGVGGEAE